MFVVAYHVALGDWIQVFKLGGVPLTSPSHLAGSASSGCKACTRGTKAKVQSPGWEGPGLALHGSWLCQLPTAAVPVVPVHHRQQCVLVLWVSGSRWSRKNFDLCPEALFSQALK